MNRLAKTSICLAGGLMLTISPRADVLSSNNPYALIATRNVFDLKQTETAETPATPVPPTPRATIKPNGIMSIFGPRQVLFKVTSPAGAGKAPKEVFCILGEGQEQDGIQVVQIDETAGRVTFNNHGVVQQIPLSAPPVTEAWAPTPDHYHPKMVGVIGTGRIPPYFVRGDEPPGQLEIPKTKEEQMQMIENLRAWYKSQNDPRAKFLPPTALTPTDEPDAAEPAPEKP
jgi:hypothetical protein